MTEDQIERIYERNMDKIDELFISGNISQNEYDDRVLALNEWAEEMYNTYNERI